MFLVNLEVSESFLVVLCMIWFTRSRARVIFEFVICGCCYGRNAERGERGWEEGRRAVAGTMSGIGFFEHFWNESL